MSNWTNVDGKIILKVNTHLGEDSLIYKIIANAPRITGSEEDCIYSIDIKDQAPYNSNDSDDYIYYEAKIKIKGHLRDREFEETDREVRNFIEYLREKTGYETKFVKGKIEVSNCPFDGLCSCDDEWYRFQIYDLGEKTEKDN